MLPVEKHPLVPFFEPVFVLTWGPTQGSDTAGGMWPGTSLYGDPIRPHRPDRSSERGEG